MAIINFNNEKWQLFRPSDRQANCHRCLISILILLCFAYHISFSGAEAILSFLWTEEMPGKFIDFAPRICFGIWITFAYLFVSTFCSSRLLSVCVCFLLLILQLCVIVGLELGLWGKVRNGPNKKNKWYAKFVISPGMCWCWYNIHTFPKIYMLVYKDMTKIYRMKDIVTSTIKLLDNNDISRKPF